MNNILKKLHERKDTEHEQVFLRAIIALTGGGYFWIWKEYLPHPPISLPFPFLYYLLPTIFGVCTALIGFFLIVRNPEPSPARRITFIVSDTLMVTWAMYIAGEIGAPWVFIYVWLILGNAFRYGTLYLLICSGVTLVGFTVLSSTSLFWRAQPIFHWAVFLILLVIPSYVYPLLSRLQRAQRRAESASAAKSRFLANVNHELRTPLNAIIGNAHLLIEDCAINGQQKRQVGDILSAAHHQLGVINDVIDMSKIESDAIEKQDTPTALYWEILSVVRLFRVHAEEKGLNLVVSVDPALPAFIAVDRQKFVQILTNLVGNAIKFTASGQVTISVRTAPQQKLIVDVSDTGPGIALKYQESIFDRFKQIDNASDRLYGGSGLGLAISRAYARVMNGDLTLVSGDQGTTFTLILPASASKDAEYPASPPFDVSVDLKIFTKDDSVLPLIQNTLQHPVLKNVELTAANPNQQNGNHTVVSRPYIKLVSTPDVNITPDRRAIATIRYQPNGSQPPLSGSCLTINDYAQLYPAIIWALCYWHTTSTSIVGEQPNPDVLGTVNILVAEDNLVNQAVVRGLLTKAGATVEIASNGKEALSYVQRGSYDLLLIDIQMPVMSGLEFIERYHHDIPTPRQVPIIILTADTAQASSAEAEALGINKILTKPLDPGTLIESIQAAVSQGAQKHLTPSGVPLLDTGYFQAILDSLNDAHDAKRIVSVFQSTASQLLDELSDAASRNDRNSGSRIIHALMSASSSIGAVCMYNHAARLHDLQTDAWRHAAAQLHEKLVALLPLTVEALERNLQSNPTHSTAP